MKDIAGTELKLGDKVAYSSGIPEKVVYLGIGFITGFTSYQVTIKPIYGIFAERAVLPTQVAKLFNQNTEK